MRWLNEKLLGIDSRRLPPAFARTTLLDRRNDLERAGQEPTGILLFPDTFTNYYEPEIGVAAVELLRQARCGVTLGPDKLVCCGRPLISAGMLDQAVRQARQNVALLHPWAAEGKPITACEPSCILTIKDDYPALLRGEGAGTRKSSPRAASRSRNASISSPASSCLSFRAAPSASSFRATAINAHWSAWHRHCASCGE